MKIFSIVGVSKSGKTATTEAIIKELKMRGYVVAAVKSIGHPDFTIDSDNHDSRRLRDAGADPVCIRAAGETDIMWSHQIEINEIIRHINADYLILEGDYISLVPQILCAHTIDEVNERISKETFLLSGAIADRYENLSDIPARSAYRNIKGLVDLIEEKVPHVQPPIQIKEEKYPHHGVRYGDKRQARYAREKLQFGDEIMGFNIYESQMGYIMHSYTKISGFENDLPVVLHLDKATGQKLVLTQVLNTFGAAILAQALEQRCVLKIDGYMDEFGQAEVFRRSLDEYINAGGKLNLQYISDKERIK